MKIKCGNTTFRQLIVHVCNFGYMLPVDVLNSAQDFKTLVTGHLKRIDICTMSFNNTVRQRIFKEAKIKVSSDVCIL